MPDRDELEQAIAHLGLPVGSTIADLTDLYRALARPSRLDAALRHLELEWIGAFDAPRPRASFLSRAELMHVLSRSVGIDAVEAFSLQDLQDGMAYTESDIQGIFSNGHLWAYGHPDLRFPRWQFTHGKDGLPSGFICDRLQVVVAAIPLNANPGLVRSLMSLSSPTLPTVQGREISPREYLLAGGAPGTVAAFLLRYLDADEDRVQDVASRMSAWP
jgi:hypothetical protein